jgi:hypothetical protein
MPQLTIDEKVELNTRHMKNWLNNGGMIISIRGRIKIVLPFDIKFMKGQTLEHNAFSEDGHEWEVAEHGQTRMCTKCFITQCDSRRVPLDQKQWVSFPASNITREDIEYLLKRQQLKNS